MALDDLEYISKLIQSGILSPEEKRKAVAHAKVLNHVLGRRCAICDFEYNTGKDILKHGAIGGYGEDVVGKKPCWDEYFKKYGPPQFKEGIA